MARRTRANVPQRQMLVIASSTCCVGGMGLAGQERRDGHDHPRLAVAALRHLVVDPGLLNGVQTPFGAEPFNGRDRRPLDGDHRHAAGTHRLAVHVDGARAAGGDAAAELGAGETEGVPKSPQERRVRVEVEQARLDR